MKHKKEILIIGITLIIVGIGAFAFLKLGISDNKGQIESSLSNMGKDFYENFYYEQVGKSSEERTNLLKKFTTIGIKIDLENLERFDNGKYKKNIKTFVNKKTNKVCSKTNTKVVVYPKSPYGKTDYKIDTMLDCGFEKAKK